MSSKSGGFSSLADLLREQGFKATPEEERPVEVKLPGVVELSAKIVVRRERKGRGGKTVTTVSGIQGDSAVIDELLRTWKKSLGRGARREGNLVVIQGDCVEQLLGLLRKLGAKQISS
jgi:translation initiation factor 1